MILLAAYGTNLKNGEQIRTRLHSNVPLLKTRNNFLVFKLPGFYEYVCMFVRRKTTGCSCEVGINICHIACRLDNNLWLFSQQ